MIKNKRLATRISDDMYYAIKQSALDHHITVQAWIIMVIAERLRKEDRFKK